MRNTNEVQAKEMEGKKYKWNKGLLSACIIWRKMLQFLYGNKA